MRSEGGESKDLDGSAGRCSRFTGQRVADQVISHHVTFAHVHLDVDRSVDCLTTQLTHRLQLSTSPYGIYSLLSLSFNRPYTFYPRDAMHSAVFATATC